MNRSLPKILIVEDDVGIQNQLQWCFDDFEVCIAMNRTEALEQFRQHNPSVVLLDLGLPPDPGGTAEGFATLKQLKELIPETKIIVITGNDERENAVNAIGLGAYDFYQKPIDRDTIGHVVKRAHNLFNLERENITLQSKQTLEYLPGLVAESPQMRQVCKLVKKIADSELTALLQGESGTGKELIAQALHSLSGRAPEPLIAINCAAIPGELLESELFGHEKGAFTGADKLRLGKIELADKGTLFLDEIGDMPLELQAKLLRFIQERVVERVGGRKLIPIDTRIIAATHKNLEIEAENGLFREDLYYRIGEVNVHIPPLRDRDGDIMLLANTFLERFSIKQKKPFKALSTAACDAMEAYSWPGNIRELENKIKQAVLLAEGQTITLDDLQFHEESTKVTPMTLKEVRENAERAAIHQAFQRSNQNISKTAELLGITRPTLYDLMAKFNIRKQKK